MWPQVQTWSTKNGYPAATINNQSGLLLARTESQRMRLLRGPLRVRQSLLDRLQFLPDGGLVRSTRIARLEAALLISGGPQSARKLAQLARLIDWKEAVQLIQVLNDSYERDRSAFRIENTAGGYQMMTRSQLAPWLERIHQRQDQMKLTPPAMETLTIIAYQQPVTRADVEAIRGVQSTDMIKQLIDRGLVRIGGEDDSLGRPFLYITTRQFLNMFGLQRLEDLPNFQTLRRQTAVPSASELDTDDEEDGEGHSDVSSAGSAA
ncbi:MAG: SMC-Scp complex subunit ScpB [Planctomycetaceae bacterium]